MVLGKLRMYSIVLYNKIILTRWFSKIRNFVFRHRYDNVQENYQKIVDQLRVKVKNGHTIKVAFYMLEVSKWKYEGLYRLMENDDRFDPYITVVPFAGGAVLEEGYLTHMKTVYDYFTSRGYKTFYPYNSDEKRMYRKNEIPEMRPDIIFHMNCWHEYGEHTQFGYMDNMDKLQAYVPYAWMISNRYIEHFNRDFHNRMWKIFYETPIHADMAKKHAINKGVNAVASGYPLLDSFFNSNYKPKDVWKRQNKLKKRVIWAPHHHMLEKNKCSNFLDICNMMVEIADKYADDVQFTFKPHPELAKKLDTCIPGWNKEKREKYYDLWDTMPNTQVCLGEYVDLFLTSDAIIHDCGSFTAEYICTYKPMLFLIANDEVVNGWNECGKEILKHIYISKKGESIESFLEKVVINGNDYKKDELHLFVDSYLKPKDENGASSFIFHYIKHELE